jgi:hypothetical protein
MNFKYMNDYIEDFLGDENLSRLVSRTNLKLLTHTIQDTRSAIRLLRHWFSDKKCDIFENMQDEICQQLGFRPENASGTSFAFWILDGNNLSVMHRNFKDFLTFKEMINDCVKFSKEQYYQRVDLSEKVGGDRKSGQQGHAVGCR